MKRNYPERKPRNQDFPRSILLLRTGPTRHCTDDTHGTLTPQGITQAQKLAQHLFDCGFEADRTDLIVTDNKIGSFQTARHLVGAIEEDDSLIRGGQKIPRVIMDDIFHSATPAHLEYLRRDAQEHRTILIVGDGPELMKLCNQLVAKEECDEFSRENLKDSLQPCEGIHLTSETENFRFRELYRISLTETAPA